MLVLGTIRLICVFADFAGSFVETWRSEWFTFGMLSKFTQEHQPILELCAAWPLLLALAVRRKRWPELLPAAAATFLILSIGGVIAFSAEWTQAGENGATIGSFHLTRRAFKDPSITDVSLGALGVIQLLLEFATAVRAVLLVPRFRGANTAESGRTDGARRARFGRLAVYASLGYLVLMIRLPVWSTYLEVLDNSTIFREFVLRNDTQRNRRPRNFVRRTNEEMRLGTTEMMLSMAHTEMLDGQFGQAQANYTQVISSADSIPEDSRPPEYHRIIAEALNGLAWLEATCPRPQIRDSGASVRHARRAVELQGNEGAYWNTLGVAYYREGEWKSAKDALARSMELRNEGDSSDWFFLALVELKLGHREQALAWYDRAVAWFHQSNPNDHELYRFHVEAAQELGLSEPAPLPLSATARVITEKGILIGTDLLERRLRSRSADPTPKPLSP